MIESEISVKQIIEIQQEIVYCTNCFSALDEGSRDKKTPFVLDAN